MKKILHFGYLFLFDTFMIKRVFVISKLGCDCHNRFCVNEVNHNNGFLTLLLPRLLPNECGLNLELMGGYS